MTEAPQPLANTAADSALQAYVLGPVDFDAALALQRRLVYQVSGDRSASALVLCEHPPLITVGRQGSWNNVLCEAEELVARHWKVRWVNRGGGCLLHQPGQLAIYPILALDRLGLGLQDYIERLQEVVVAVLDDFSIRAHTRPGQPAVWVGDRPVAGIGIAVRDWVTYYGAVLNINPNLEVFRRVLTCGSGRAEGAIMTSIERERRGPLRPALVRERLLEHFAQRFAFARTSLFFEHPLLRRKAPLDALATRS